MHNATTLQGSGNATINAILSRLPRKPILNAREIADALDMRTTDSVAAAAECGALRAARVGGRYRVARAEAERWIRSLEAAK